MSHKRHLKIARTIDPFEVLKRPVTKECARGWLRKYKKNHANTTYEDIMFWRASGSYFDDIIGKRYLNFGAGMLGLNIGANHPDLKQVLREFIDYDLCGIGSCELGNVYAAALDEKIIEITPGDFRKRVF